MGRSQSKPKSTVPIQSYIDYVTDKSKILWEKNLTSSPRHMRGSEIPLKLSNNYQGLTKKSKKSISKFFGLCTYKEQNPDNEVQCDV